jgi:hypothetical protein
MGKHRMFVISAKGLRTKLVADGRLAMTQIQNVKSLT